MLVDWPVFSEPREVSAKKKALVLNHVVSLVFCEQMSKGRNGTECELIGKSTSVGSQGMNESWGSAHIEPTPTCEVFP